MRGRGQDKERLQGPSEVHHASELQRTLEFCFGCFSLLTLVYSQCPERELLLMFMGVLQFKVLWS